METSDFALLVQVLAASASAVAAVFAWLTARRVRMDEWRRRASEHLGAIHHLITDLVEAAHAKEPQLFGLQMRLRAELAVAYGAPLDKCLELVDRSYGKTMTIEDLDKLAPAALAEVEAAHQAVWNKPMITYVYLAADQPPASSEPRS